MGVSRRPHHPHTPMKSALFLASLAALCVGANAASSYASANAASASAPSPSPSMKPPTCATKSTAKSFFRNVCTTKATKLTSSQCDKCTTMAVKVLTDACSNDGGKCLSTKPGGYGLKFNTATACIKDQNKKCSDPKDVCTGATGTCFKTWRRARSDEAKLFSDKTCKALTLKDSWETSNKVEVFGTNFNPPIQRMRMENFCVKSPAGQYCHPNNPKALWLPSPRPLGSILTVQAPNPAKSSAPKLSRSLTKQAVAMAPSWPSKQPATRPLPGAHWPPPQGVATH